MNDSIDYRALLKKYMARALRVNKVVRALSVDSDGRPVYDADQKALNEVFEEVVKEYNEGIGVSVRVGSIENCPSKDVG